MSRSITGKLTDVTKGSNISNLFEDAKNIIDLHWRKNEGKPGKPISDIEFLNKGFRVQYESGAIYAIVGKSVAWIHGAIADKYNALGNINSWLGFPLSDETDFPE